MCRKVNTNPRLAPSGFAGTEPRTVITYKIFLLVVYCYQRIQLKSYDYNIYLSLLQSMLPWNTFSDLGAGSVVGSR